MMDTNQGLATLSLADLASVHGGGVGANAGGAIGAAVGGALGSAYGCVEGGAIAGGSILANAVVGGDLMSALFAPVGAVAGCMIRSQSRGENAAAAGRHVGAKVGNAISFGR